MRFDMTTLETEFFPAKKKSTRLMVVLHGLGDSSAGFHWLPAALNLDWMNYLLVNAPDEYYGGYSWYDFAGNPEPGIVRSRKLIFELLDAQRAKGFPTEQTILFGFSQGCLMTLEAGLRYPHLFAGLVGISGYVNGPERTIKEFSAVALKQRVLVTHGFQDPILPFEQTREQMDRLKAAGVKLEWHEFMKAHTIAGEAEMTVIRDFVVAGYPKI
jgi:phospholipase/carboxylesterase